MSKKSEIPLYVLVSIVITIAGILLLFVFIGKNTDTGKRFYCNSLYNREEKLDPFCEEFLSIEKGSMRPKEVHLDRLGTGRSLEFANLTNANNHRYTTQIKIPRGARIRNAAVQVGIARQYITLFKGNRNREVVIVPLNRPTIGKWTAGIPEGSRITNARLEVQGVKYPSRANLVFVVDTSGSMNNEWTMLCSILLQINKTLHDMGLNVTSDIYGLAEGETVGDCMTGRITGGELDTVMPLSELGSPSGSGPWTYAPWDFHDEAWAVGSAWLADNYPWNFDTDVKRIVIPISDSDPTGGGPTHLSRNSKWTNDAQFKGTEQSSIDLAVSMATIPPEKHVYIIPVYGDESEPAERYGLGHIPCKIPQCTQVIGWMQELADRTGATATGAGVTGFNNFKEFLNNLLDVIVTPYPTDIDISVNRNAIWSFERELNTSNSPQLVTSPLFVQRLNECLASPAYCSNGMCQCEIGVTSDDGTVIFEKMKIEYIMDPHLQYLEAGNEKIPFPSAFGITSPEQVFDITEPVKASLANCPPEERECIVSVTLQGTSTGAATLSNLNLTYEYYDLEGIILEGILGCWKETSKGNVKKSYLCREITVPESYEYIYPITEESITNLIRDRNFCHIIGNSMIGNTNTNCGEDDRIEFAQDIYNTRNILIEYNGEKIIVS